ncbi:MAG TPA: cytochrome C oxidase subunit IV family protein [Pirellulales bacterium]|nr:cytochrome C oxidase subunit IV family protein [Pirellulales bacterium]
MHDASHSADAHAHAHGDHGGIAKYVYVFLALCVLTGCSFFTYSSLWPWHDQPQVGRTFMMAVSCTKAMLVILFFMHLKYEADWKYVLTIPASIMSILLMMALVPDVGLRMRTYSPERREHAAMSEKEYQKFQTEVKKLEPVHDESGHAPAAAH